MVLALLQTSVTTVSSHLDDICRLENALQLAQVLARDNQLLSSIMNGVDGADSASAFAGNKGFQELLRHMLQDARKSRLPGGRLRNPANVCTTDRKIFQLQCALIPTIFCCVLIEKNTRDLICLPLVQHLSEICQGSPLLGHTCDGKDQAASYSETSLFEAERIPASTAVSFEWRAHIGRMMRQDATTRTASVIQLVGEVCRDLESRCNDVEQPLHNQREKTRHLEQDLGAAKTTVAHLEGQHAEKHDQIIMLEKERDDLIERTGESDRRLSSLSSTFEKISEEFRQAKHDAQRAAETATALAQQQDLAYRASLAGKEEALEQKGRDLAASGCKTEHLENEVHDLRVQLAQEKEAKGCGERRFSFLQDEFASLQDELKTAEEARNRLEKENCELVEARSQLKTKADDTELSLTSRNADLQLQLNNAHLSMEQSNKQVQVLAADKEDGERRLIERHDTAIEKYRKDLSDASSEAAQFKRKQETKIKDLCHEIDTLRKEQQLHAKEFAQAQDLSSKLMAVVGLKRSAPSQSLENVALTAMKLPLERVDENHTPVGKSFGPSTRHFTKEKGSRNKSPRLQRSMTSPAMSPLAKTPKTRDPSNICSSAITPTNRVSKRFMDSSPTMLSHGKDRRISTMKAIHQSADKENQGQAPIFEDSFDEDEDEVFTSTDQERLLNGQNHALHGGLDETTMDL